MSETTDKNLLFDYLLRLADNALLTGQRLGEWVGKGPQLEEEMAFANFALDYIGQARLLYGYAGTVEGKGHSEDDLAFLRDGIDFHNVLLVEQPNGNFADTIARLFLFESFYRLQLAGLEASSDATLRAFAVRAGKEIRYHCRHVRQWLLRLGDGTDESHGRIQAGIDNLWRYSGELFIPDDVEQQAAVDGLGPDVAELQAPWHQEVSHALQASTLKVPEWGWMATGGKSGEHTEHLGYMLADMQFMQRAYPGATW